MASPNTRVWIAGLQERFFDYDPVSGIRTFMSTNKNGDWQFRHEFADVSHEVDASKALATTDDHWKEGVKKEMVHYAHIPTSILFKWHCEGVDIKDSKELMRMVNKPEWAYLRCTGKICT